MLSWNLKYNSLYQSLKKFWSRLKSTALNFYFNFIQKVLITSQLRCSFIWFWNFNLKKVFVLIFSLVFDTYLTSTWFIYLIFLYSTNFQLPGNVNIESRPISSSLQRFNSLSKFSEIFLQKSWYVCCKPL